MNHGVPIKVLLFLAVGLVAASQSGNIVRLGDAPPTVMAAWRLLMATVMLAPLAGRDLQVLRRVGVRHWALLLLTGLALALHFVTWIAAVQLTTVANAAVLFSVNPVLTAAAAWLFFRESVGAKLLVAIGIGLLGIVVMGWADLNLQPELWLGDLTALTSSLLFTVYLLGGKGLRGRVPTTAYVTSVYAVAAVLCFVFAVVSGASLVAYDGRTWTAFLLLALVPTMIGHTAINHAVAYVKAGWLSMATTSEALFAGLGAYLLWQEQVTWQTALGYALIISAVIVLVFEKPAVQGGTRVPAIDRLR